MPQQIPAEIKADYLRALIGAGFRHIDAVSFVSSTAVPQMSDSEQVLAMLDPDTDVEIIGIVVNQQGAERAIRSSVVDTLGFPYSLSATFLERNQRQTRETALETLGNICALASNAGLDVVAYLSMAFGNPYGETWRQEDVIAACQTLQALGLKQISLADTVGVAETRADRIASGRGAGGSTWSGARSSSARSTTACRRKGRSSLQGGLQAPGQCSGGLRRLSLRPGRPGGQRGHRSGTHRTEKTGGGATPPGPAG